MWRCQSSLARAGLGVIASVVLSLVLVLPAVADSTTATLNVTGGTLSETAPTTGPSASVTLDGTDQTTSYTMAISINDTRGTGAGWNLQVTSTQFSTGGTTPSTLAANASTITAINSACVVGGTCVAPTNNVTYPLGMPAGATAPTPVKMFNAATSSGLGRFTLTPTVQIAVPATTLAGAYTSTITLSIVSGP